MAYLEWSDKLSLGINQIDEEHKGLIDILNHLHTAMMDEQHQENTEELLQQLSDYVMKHFGTEEQYFKQFDYPDAENHIEEHKQFRAQIEKFKESHNDGDITLLFPMVKMLKDWIEKHICVIDRKYTAFFKANGLK